MAKNTSISLSDHFIDYATRQVGSGRFGSISEVIRDGLRLHQERQARIDALDAAIEEGLNSGPPRPFDADDFMRRVRIKYGDGRTTP
jgi:antitoxin ParD1/3/4